MFAFSLGYKLSEDGDSFGSSLYPQYLSSQHTAQECCLANMDLTCKDTCYIKFLILTGVKKHVERDV